MRKAFFDQEFMKNTSKIVFCPLCNNKFTVNLEEKEVTCEECDAIFSIDFLSEEFVWHPSEKY